MKPKIDTYLAEDMVRKMAEGELIEDRVYELAQDLVNQYIGKVENNHEIEGLDEYPSDVEWYDEVREDAKHILFEKLAEFFRA